MAMSRCIGTAGCVLAVCKLLLLNYNLRRINLLAVSVGIAAGLNPAGRPATLQCPVGNTSQQTLLLLSKSDTADEICGLLIAITGFCGLYGLLPRVYLAIASSTLALRNISLLGLGSSVPIKITLFILFTSFDDRLNGFLMVLSDQLP